MKTTLCKHALHGLGLSPKEAKFAQALVDHCKLDNAANAMFVSRNTAKFHLRNIFSKTGCRNQAELVKVLLVRAWVREE